MMLVIMVAMIAMVASVMAAAPAHAAPIKHIDGQGSQSSGRWQVFNLDNAEVSNGLDVVTWWEGNGNVNVFLLDSRGKTLAFENETGAAPSVVQYNGSTQVDKIAILVKSGAADWSSHLHAFGTAPYLSGNPTPPPTTPAPPTEPDPPAPAANEYPGQPPAGTVLWGASVDGNKDPWTIHEQAAGEVFGVRRTYFSWNQRARGMVNIARADAERGRVPWVSVKTPSWTSMANGTHDTEIDEMLRGLDNVDGPVWLTVHHEPEGGGDVNGADDPGGPSSHVAMNRRIRQRMDRLGVDNVALAPVLMAWTFNPRSGRNPNVWWEDGIYDFIGIDIFTDTNQNLLFDNWYDLREWAEGKGIDVAVGEWGMRGSDNAAEQRVRAWHEDAWRSNSDDRGARVVALAAWDNTRDNRTLRGGQLRAFRDLLDDSRSHTHG